jgi:hypothetical protein
LSDPNEEPIVEKRFYNQLNNHFNLIPINSVISDATTNSWKEVVQRRIEKNTRIISKVFLNF